MKETVVLAALLTLYLGYFTPVVGNSIVKPTQRAGELGDWGTVGLNFGYCPSFCDHAANHNGSKYCLWPPHCCEDPIKQILYCCDNETLAIERNRSENWNCDNHAWAWWEQYWKTILGCGLALGAFTFICSLVLCIYQAMRDRRRRLQRNRAVSNASSSSRDSNIRPHTNRRRESQNENAVEVISDRDDGIHFTIVTTTHTANPNTGEFVFHLGPIQPPPYTADKPPPYVP